MPERQHATWGELLREAVEKPGRTLEAYTAFHNYSGTPCLRWNSVRCATCNPDHSTPITVGLNGNGKSAKGRKESPFACPFRLRKPLRPMASKTTVT